MQRQTAFTLTEILVTVAIMGVMALFGFTSYGRFAEKVAVENAGKELITFIRSTQMRSRNGDRGTGNCKISIAKIAGGTDASAKLYGWKVKFSSNGATSHPICTSGYADGTGGYEAKPFESNINLYCTRNKGTCSYLFTKSVFGDTWYDGTAEGATKNQIFVVTDGTFHYHFALVNGSVTNGSYCTNFAGTSPDCKKDCFCDVANME